MARQSPAPADIDAATATAAVADAAADASSSVVGVTDTTMATSVVAVPGTSAIPAPTSIADSAQSATPAAPGSNNDKKRIVLRRYVAQDDKDQHALLAAVAAGVPLSDGSSAVTSSSAATPATAMTGEKRKRGGGERLNDAQRLEIIRLRRQENPPSLRKIAREFNVSDRSIRNVMLSAAEIEKRNENVDIKFQLRTFRMAAPRFPELEDRTFEWITSLRKAQMNPTPTAIIEKARAIAAEMGITPSEFKASPGWFERFRKRRHLVDKRMCVGGDDGNDSKTSAGDAINGRHGLGGATVNGVVSDLSGTSSGTGLDDASSDSTAMLPAHLTMQQQLLMLQAPLQQTLTGAGEPVGVYELVHAIVELENKLRSFQRANPSENGRLQQCLANATVIRHDLLAVHANMQVRSLRSGTTPPKAPAVAQLHGLGDLA